MEPIPGDLHISLLEAEDFSAVKSLQPHDWPDIMPNIRFYVQSANCYTVKSEYDGKLAGIGTAIFHPNVVWLANIIVKEEFRGKGLGTVITAHLLGYAERQRRSIMLIATEAGKPIYEKLGFVHESVYLFFNNISLSLPRSAYITPFHDSFRNAMLQLDASVSGEERTWLIEPHFHTARLFVKDDTLMGFYLPTLAEGLTIASTDEAGIELLKLRLLEQNRLVIPGQNQSAIAFLAEQGLSPMEGRVGYRMYKGQMINWRPECVFGRIGGNLG